MDAIWLLILLTTLLLIAVTAWSLTGPAGRPSRRGRSVPGRW